MKVWHFSRNDDCLGYNDGRKIVLGETLSVDGTPVLCEHGLHGSISILDAMKYASGSHLWLVDITGDLQKDKDKICGKYRTALQQYGDVLPLLEEFAFWCSSRAAEYAARSAAEYAGYVAKYAGYVAKYVAESEIKEQENWWAEKLAQIS